MRHTIRNKLIASTVLPVLAVYSILFWAGVSHVREQQSAGAHSWLLEHARRQASQLALVLSQAPALAGSLGDLVLADPDQAQTLLYAHLIDGLRRNPIVNTAAVEYGSPPRGAMMRRGEPVGVPLSRMDSVTTLQPGWHVMGDRLRFERPIYRRGETIGRSWVEIEVADVYREIEQQRSGSVILFMLHEHGPVLAGNSSSAQVSVLARALPDDVPLNAIVSISDKALGSEYWLIRTELPGLPWHITAATRAETALGPARHEASLVALGLLLSLIAIVVIIGMAARQITRPLEILDASVGAIAEGNFAVSPDVASDDELGRLAATITRMARLIAERESQLHWAHQVLEQRVAERTAALQQSNTLLIKQIEETRETQDALRRANEQTQQASRAKSEFLSNMSHELRTPLHGVLGYAQILRRDTTTGDAQRESLEAIERCGQHLLTLINDILDMTKIEAGQMQVDLRPTDLQQLFEDVRMIIAQRAANKGLKLVFELADDLPAGVQTDAVKLRQILLNLLGNAVKFTTDGVVTLTARYDDGSLCFEVADTGVGIPADRVNTIFDAFNQARDGHAVDGTGLGLAINQRLIRLLGGEALSITSTPGEGSRFRFRVPGPVATIPARGHAAHTSADAATRLQLREGQTCSVMVVDENAENREVVATLLRYANCEVETFTRRSEAASRLAEKTFDLVLLDVRLPDAGSAAAALVAGTVLGTPKLVAMSASVFRDVENVAAQAGFDAFLGKPFNDRQLFDLITALLDVRFDATQLTKTTQAPSTPWPHQLAGATARRIRDAVTVGDVGSLFQLAEELADHAEAPAEDVEHIARMARAFDFDGLTKLAERLDRVDAGWGVTA